MARDGEKERQARANTDTDADIYTHQTRAMIARTHSHTFFTTSSNTHTPNASKKRPTNAIDKARRAVFRTPSASVAVCVCVCV